MSSPKLFISYSWSSPEHEAEVLQLATELRESGVDVILDKWDLKEGHDAHAFMEKMVTDPTIKKVAIISDKTYATKADGRAGGVGTEAQIISSEIYGKTTQDKFVAVVTEKDGNGNAYVPTYYKSKIYIDLSEQDTYSENFDRLLRWVFDKPLYIKPDIGEKPAFLDEAGGITLGTSATQKRAIDAIKSGKASAGGHLEEYLDLLSSNLEKFRLCAPEKDGEFDDEVVANIELFIPYRNEYIQVISTVSTYDAPIEWVEKIHRFFETLIPYMHRPAKLAGTFRSWEFDNFKFIIHELFLHTIAVFLKHGRFTQVAYLLSHQYYTGDMQEYYAEPLASFYCFDEQLESLEYRNRRLAGNRRSIRADLLKERCAGTGIEFRQLMQADFLLYLYTELHLGGGMWAPDTLVFSHFRGRASFELFARAKSKAYFEKMKIALGISDPKELIPFIESCQKNRLSIPYGGAVFFPPTLIDVETLASIP